MRVGGMYENGTLSAGTIDLSGKLPFEGWVMQSWILAKEMSKRRIKLRKRSS